jgi:hypothetical protein
MASTRRLAAILAADVAGYSRLMGADEEGALERLKTRTDEAIAWFEKASSAWSGLPVSHAWLASAYALKGETERGAAQLTEARRLDRDNRYSSIARVEAAGGPGAPGYWGVPKVRALIDATYFAGLRKAGMPEE